jgi:N-acetylmuramoyl-L-alanine amidase
MEPVDQTKLRLIREAIQHNVETVKGIRRRPAARDRRLGVLRLCATLLIAATAYLAVPSRIEFTRSASSSTAVKPVEVLMDVAEAPTLAMLSSTPRRLSRAVFPLSIKRVVIDPGHGGAQHGAMSSSGVSEKEITLDIGLRLQKLMQEANFEVFMTRQVDETMALDARVAFANAKKADIFVSIHVNWVERREARPLETFYMGPTDDPATLRLASAENRDSGYSLSEYRQLLERVYLDARRDESRRLAGAIQDSLYASLRPVNPGLDNRGVKMAPFFVLAGTQMPAILAEVSCLSNADEVELLMSTDYRDKIARALLKGVRAYAQTLNGTKTKGS